MLSLAALQCPLSALHFILHTLWPVKLKNSNSICAPFPVQISCFLLVECASRSPLVAGSSSSVVGGRLMATGEVRQYYQNKIAALPAIHCNLE
jgi:hypothetical protein